VAGIPVDLVEADLFGIGGGRVERDGTGDERKAQKAFPVGAGGHGLGTPDTVSGFKTNGMAWFRRRRLLNTIIFTKRVVQIFHPTGLDFCSLYVLMGE
jgi:hypothetical protein